MICPGLRYDFIPQKAEIPAAEMDPNIPFPESPTSEASPINDAATLKEAKNLVTPGKPLLLITF